MTYKEIKSCVGTIEMLRRLAYNIHGVMDVIDADNCEKIIKALEQEPILEKDGTLIVTTEHCEKVGRVLVQYGTNGTLFYQDQEQRKGHWVAKPHVFGVRYCSECDFELRIDNTNFCPNCGAKMAESEGKE